MGNGQNIGKKILEQGKNLAKEAAKKVLNAVVTNVYFWIAIGVAALLVIIICLFCNFSEMGVTASAAEVSNTEATGWWWPIGSMETSTENGKLFASGEPALGASSVSRVGPNGGSKWGISAGAHDGNLGLDVGAGSETNKYYVISIGNGTVKTVADGVPEGRSNANGGCGNYVEVDYGEIIVRFLHLYAGSIKVSTGDSVTYGQVIGKIGHNGDSTGPHSHTDYKDKDGNWLDPVDIVDPNDPRPVETTSYASVGGSDIGKEFLRSYENTSMNQYIKGEISDYNSTNYIYLCITKDKSKYKMCDDIGTGNRK